jgi:hypothetical protein
MRADEDTGIDLDLSLPSLQPSMGTHQSFLFPLLPGFGTGPLFGWLGMAIQK